MRWRRLRAAAVLLAIADPAAAQVKSPDFVIGGQFNTTAPALSNNQISTFQLDSAGRLIVNPGATGGGITTTMTGAAVTTQNTFQSALAANPARKGATLQNTSASDVLYIFFGATASATKPTSFQLAAGQSISAVNGATGVLTDNIAVTCADATPANCTFVIASQ